VGGDDAASGVGSECSAVSYRYSYSRGGLWLVVGGIAEGEALMAAGLMSAVTEASLLGKKSDMVLGIV